MPVIVSDHDIQTLQNAVARFGGIQPFERAAGLPQSTMPRFFKKVVSEKRAAEVSRAAEKLLGITISFAPFIEARYDKAGVPEFKYEHRAVFNAMVREAGFRSTIKLAEAIGFNPQNFCSMFSNHISSHIYHPLRAAVLEATGIDLDELSASTIAAAEVAPGPLEDMYSDGLITDAELAAGQRLATAASGRDYPGREPLPCLVRTWPKDLQAAWAALVRADAETDQCRPRLPTASLVAWNVCVSRELVHPRDPSGRDALTSLRIALQHLPGAAP